MFVSCMPIDSRLVYFSMLLHCFLELLRWVYFATCEKGLGACHNDGNKRMHPELRETDRERESVCMWERERERGRRTALFGRENNWWRWPDMFMSELPILLLSFNLCCCTTSSIHSALFLQFYSDMQQWPKNTFYWVFLNVPFTFRALSYMQCGTRFGASVLLFFSSCTMLFKRLMYVCSFMLPRSCWSKKNKCVKAHCWHVAISRQLK